MDKTGIFLMMTLMFGIPLAYAHPDLVGVSVMTQDGLISDDQIFGLKKEKQENNAEFLSEEWFYQNFFWLLGGSITVIMGTVVVIEYREEIFRKPTQANRPNQTKN